VVLATILNSAPRSAAVRASVYYASQLPLPNQCYSSKTNNKEQLTHT
jgi:hypothetical protein